SKKTFSSCNIPLDKKKKATTIGGTKWEKVVGSGANCETVDEAIERVIRSANTPGGIPKGKNAAGQLSSDGRRDGQGENPGRLPGGVAAFGQKVLRDERERRSRPGLSHESMGRNRKEAREKVVLQPSQTKVSNAHQLLRASRRGGWARAHSNSTGLAGIRVDEGRSGCAGRADVPANLESRAVPRAARP